MSESESDFASGGEEVVDNNDNVPTELSGSNDDEDEASQLREQLQDVPLGEIKKLKDQVGLKRYNQVLFGIKTKNTEDEDNEGSEEENDGRKKHLKRKSMNDTKPQAWRRPEKIFKKQVKSEPMEISSKRKMFNDKPRHVVKDAKRSTRDPRFNDLHGNYNESLFKKSYAFVDDIKKDEYESVKKQLKKVKNVEQKEKLLKVKQKIDTDMKVEAEKIKKQKLFKEQKQQAYEQAKSGKKAYYLKKSDQKKIELADKYKELKSTGKLDNYMMKKRKRNSQKDKKSLPRLKE